jgi:hypothetical protein
MDVLMGGLECRDGDLPSPPSSALASSFATAFALSEKARDRAENIALSVASFAGISTL